MQGDEGWRVAGERAVGVRGWGPLEGNQINEETLVVLVLFFSHPTGRDGSRRLDPPSDGVLRHEEQYTTMIVCDLEKDRC